MGNERIVVIGVGNEYRHDDGAAVSVLAQLAAEDLAVDRLTLCDGEPTRLMELWEDAGLAIVVDAVHGHPGEPGRIHSVTVDADHLLADPLVDEESPAGTHGLGLGHGVALAAALGRLPRELLIVAVEGADFSIGEGLSPAVTDAVPRAVSEVRRAVEAHRAEASGP
ncbi:MULTISPECIES: hydrogenase maturation protease [Kitasatospora]|uniref:Hydrogenase maturation protease n=1 Tax=Kitasatospora cathayae TaxID=3004092 RepID=A0ABY7PVX1_9ACTN|nr:hydrogenase maturation protease [Kitasatospora sp. HUAS 3-15]WBP84511.1 hydrogenase maturation protease [Kitasatospora sp. HUAS 3-15]